MSGGLLRDELLGLGFRCAFTARSGVGHLGRSRIGHLADDGLAEWALRERFDRRGQMGATLGSEQIHDVGHAFAGLARVGDDLDVGLLQRFGLLAADHNVALDAFDGHQVLLVADVAADFLRQDDLRLDGSELHGLLSRCICHADCFDTLGPLALGLELTVGNDHRGFPVLLCGNDLLGLGDFGLPNLFDLHDTHLTFHGDRSLRLDLLLSLLVGDTNLLLSFSGSLADCLSSVLSADIDSLLSIDFRCFGFLLVVRDLDAAFHVDLRGFLRHDVGDNLAVATVTDVHQFHGLHRFDTPLLELFDDFSCKGFAELRALEHDIVDLVAGEDLADRALHDLTKLRIEFSNAGDALSSQGCIVNTEERRDVDHEGNAIGVVGFVAVEREVEVAHRQLDDRDPELRNPAGPAIVDVATFEAGAVGHRGATALDDVHHVGAHDLAVKDGEDDGKDHQYADQDGPDQNGDVEHVLLLRNWRIFSVRYDSTKK